MTMNTDYQRQEDVEQGNITRRFVLAIVWGLFAQIMPVLHVFSVACVLLACWHAWQVVLLRCCAERREERGEIYVRLAYA